MSGAKKILTALSFVVAVALAGSATADEMSNTSGNIKATLKADPKNSMVDLYLMDTDTRSEITAAKVKAVITTPKGKVEKELMGMKMGEAYSFMNSLDMSAKGRYDFDIYVDTGKKKTKFGFSHEVK